MFPCLTCFKTLHISNVVAAVLDGHCLKFSDGLLRREGWKTIKQSCFKF